MDYVENNDEKQIKLLARFKTSIENFTNVTYSEEYLLRWLKVADFDIKKAKEMLIINLRTRELLEFNNILDYYKTDKLMDELEFVTFLGFDKENFPIFYVSTTKADMKGILHTYSMVQIVMHSVYWMEKLKMFFNERNEKIHREFSYTVIMDMYKVPLKSIARKIVIEFGLEILRLLQEFYPGIIDKVLVINAPIYFSAMFHIFKPILKADIIEKIIVCDKNSSPRMLLKYIDRDVLPAFIGGTRVDENGDPFCSAFIKFGNFVPENLFLQYQPKLDVLEPNVIQILIHARNYKDVSVNVDKPNSKLNFEFWSDGTIGIQIFYQANCNKLDDTEVNFQSTIITEEKLSAYLKVFSHVAPVNHTIFCSKPGLYIIRFDNSFSWFTSKLVVYRTTILPFST